MKGGPQQIWEMKAVQACQKALKNADKFLKES
jgi:hypothetical protein